MPGTLKLKSEAGGSVILAANTTAVSDLTVTVPAAAGTMMVSPQLLTIPNVSGTAMVSGNMPAFSAYKSGNQSFSGSTWTKGTFTLEEYDTNSNFDTTNSRFLPTVAGYYQISCNGYLNAASDAYMQLYKNGTGLSPAFYTNAGFSFTFFHLTLSNLIYLNGSTDYLELWFYSNAASPVLSASGSHFQGILVRSA